MYYSYSWQLWNRIPWQLRGLAPPPKPPCFLRGQPVWKPRSQNMKSRRRSSKCLDGHEFFWNQIMPKVKTEILLSRGVWTISSCFYRSVCPTWQKHVFPNKSHTSYEIFLTWLNKGCITWEVHTSCQVNQINDRKSRRRRNQKQCSYKRLPAASQLTLW